MVKNVDGIKARQKLKAHLLNSAEKILDQRRSKLIQMKLNLLREMAHPNMEYDKKHNFIESSIERDFFYFKTDDFMGGFQQIRE